MYGLQLRMSMDGRVYTTWDYNLRMSTTSLGMSSETNRQGPQAMDNWEEKMGSGGNRPASEVRQHGGDDQAVLDQKQQMGQDEKSMSERRRCDAVKSFGISTRAPSSQRGGRATRHVYDGPRDTGSR